MEAVMIGIAVAAALAGLFLYNPMRRKMAGIIGVGGAYMILIGVMLLVTFVASLFRGSFAESGMSDIVMSLIFMVGTLGYMVYVMIARCRTTQQKVLLPIAAVLIGFGFCYRLIWALITHAPISTPAAPEAIFPESIMSPSGDHFQREWAAGECAAYWCAKTGEKVQFHSADFQEGYPSGWYEA